MLQGLAATAQFPGANAVDGDSQEAGGAPSGSDEGAPTAAIDPVGSSGGNASTVPTTPITLSPPSPSQLAVAAAGDISGLLQGLGAGAPAGASAHDATTPADAAAAGEAAARIATFMPQLLAVAPAATGSAAIAGAIGVPMSDPSWPQALAAQVHWMAGSQVQSATLRLSPEHLGPVQVRIELQQSQINVSFSAAHADTRAALADAIPRLRELLASGGLSLGQANVQQESPGAGSHPARPGSSSGADAETVQPVAVGATRALGLVDEYV
jgi:flagellar hook-length control protein FliK